MNVVSVLGHEVNTVNWLRMNVCICSVLFSLYIYY